MLKEQIKLNKPQLPRLQNTVSLLSPQKNGSNENNLSVRHSNKSKTEAETYIFNDSDDEYKADIITNSMKCTVNIAEDNNDEINILHSEFMGAKLKHKNIHQEIKLAYNLQLTGFRSDVGKNCKMHQHSIHRNDIVLRPENLSAIRKMRRNAKSFATDAFSQQLPSHQKNEVIEKESDRRVRSVCKSDDNSAVEIHSLNDESVISPTDYENDIDENSELENKNMIFVLHVSIFSLFLFLTFALYMHHILIYVFNRA